MTLRAGIRDLGRPDEGSWREIARLCPYATYFHTPGWASLMRAVFPNLACRTRSFRLADGTDVVVPALGWETESSGAMVTSMVPGVYGGPIAERGLAREEVEAVVGMLVDPGEASLRVVGNPFLEAFRVEVPGEASNFTHVIGIDGDFDELFRRFRQNHRRSYRYALRAGVTLSRAESIDDVRDYYEVYQADRRRWGARAMTDYPLRLFEEIHRRNDPGIVLWLARLDGRIIAGDVWLYWNRHDVGWHGAADPAFFKAFPTNFLVTEILRDACERGDRWFDLNPSGGLEGVVRFKEAFGARRIPFRHVERPRREQRPQGTSRRILERIVRSFRP